MTSASAASVPPSEPAAGRPFRRKPTLRSVEFRMGLVTLQLESSADAVLTTAEDLLSH